MAKIFRTLLVAAVNAIKEFLAFATKECLEAGLKNATMVGELNNEDGVFSGFSANDRIKIDNNLPSSFNSMTFIVNFKTPSTIGTDDYPIIIQNGAVKDIFLEGSTKTICQWNGSTKNSGITQLQEDKDYELKIIYENGSYTCYVDNISQFTTSNDIFKDALLCFGGSAANTQYFEGSIDMKNTSITIDGQTTNFYSTIPEVGDSVKLNDGMATSNYDWSAYPSDTEITGDYTQTGTIEAIKEVGENTVYTTQEPQQDNKDVSINSGEMYYAYTNANDESVYATDNPIIERHFQLLNATVVGELNKNNGIYSGFGTSNYLQSNFIPDLTNPFTFIMKFKQNSTRSYNWLFATTGSEHKGFACFINSSNKLFLSTGNSAGNGWQIDRAGVSELSNNRDYWLKYTFDGTSTHNVYLSTTGEFNGEETTEFTKTDGSGIYSASSLLLGHNYSWNGNHYFDGFIDMLNTSITINNVTTDFGSFSNPSTLYDNTFTALNPQPEYTVNNVGLINATEIGTLTNNNGIYSGFSSSNYIQLGISLTSSDTYKFITSITTTSSLNRDDILSNYSTYYFYIREGYLGFWDGNNRNTGTTLLQTNSKYWVGFEWTGSNTITYFAINDDTYTKDTLPPFSDTSFWTLNSTFSANLLNGQTIYLGGCNAGYITGSLDMNNTIFVINGNNINFYNKIVNITIDNIEYTKTSDNDLVQPITATIETVDNTTINSVTVSTPTQGYVDIPYYAYTNENDNADTLYATDNPVSKGIFNLQNATNNGCTYLGNGIYQCSFGNNITTSIGTDIQTASKWEICCRYNNQSASSYPTIFAPVDGSYTQNPFLQLVSNKMYLFLKDVNSNDIIQGDTGYTLPSGFHLIQVGWTGTKYYMNVDGDEKWYYNSSVATKSNQDIMFLNLTNQSTHWGYAIDMSQTSITIDNTTTNFGYFSNPSVLYENTGTTEFTPVALDPQPEFELGTKYSGGLNSSITIVGNLSDTNGVFSGFSNSNYLDAGQTFKSTNNVVYEITATVGNIFATVASCDKLFNIGYYNQTLSTYNYGTESSVGSTYMGNNWGRKTTYKIEINGTMKTFSMKFTDDPNSSYTVLWSGEDTGMDASYNSDLYLGSGPNLYTIEDGNIDMANSSVTINGVKIPFYTEKLPYSIIQIENDTYARNVNKDNFTRETVPATIETSANITTSNNDTVITDGSYHLFNLTVPTDMTSIIESSGISYQPANMPLLLKSNTGVGLLIKDGNNAYYRNTWVITRDYDLHYQQINFSYPSGATVACKVNNVAQNNLTPYVYAGDIVSWTCDNAGTVTTGSYTVKYSSKDGNIQIITIS